MSGIVNNHIAKYLTAHMRPFLKGSYAVISKDKIKMKLTQIEFNKQRNIV